MTTFILDDAEATTRLGEAIAPLLEAGEAVLLYGPLGMGKSTLARGLIRALTSPDEDVPSPTFTLVQFYESDPAIAHFDLYRLSRPETDREAFMASYAGLAALNEARILGIFARLIARDAKPKYAAFMPRMWAHLNANLKAPGLEAVAAWMDRHVPEDVRR